MQRRHISVRLLSLSLIAGFTLSACGIKGDLKTPPPLWGDDIRSEAQKADAERAKVEREQRKAEKAARKAQKAAESSK